MPRIAVFGGVYANPYALRSLLDDARERGCVALYCLGDLGGFGADCDAVWSLLLEHDVTTIAGNYDVAVGRGDEDCGCGYADPRDNAFAQLMYDYTRAHTSAPFAAWMSELPRELRRTIGGVDVHMVHGSPLAINDFMWESLPDEELAVRTRASGAQLLCARTPGSPGSGRSRGRGSSTSAPSGARANDGRTAVRYAVIDLAGGRVERVELVALDYDWRAQAASMRAAALPEPFVETIETGWWTTCLEVVPPRERAGGRFHVYRDALPAPAASAAAGAAGWADTPAPRDDGRPAVSLFGSALFPPRLWIYSNFHCNLACDYCVVASSPRAPARAVAAALPGARRRGRPRGLRRDLHHRRRAVRAPADRVADRILKRPAADRRADQRDALHRPSPRGAGAPRGAGPA